MQQHTINRIISCVSWKIVIFNHRVSLENHTTYFTQAAFATSWDASMLKHFEEICCEQTQSNRNMRHPYFIRRGLFKMTIEYSLSPNSFAEI